jgi:hypothetical protein
MEAIVHNIAGNKVSDIVNDLGVFPLSTSILRLGGVPARYKRRGKFFCRFCVGAANLGNCPVILNGKINISIFDNGASIFGLTCMFRSTSPIRQVAESRQ